MPALPDRGARHLRHHLGPDRRPRTRPGELQDGPAGQARGRARRRPRPGAGSLLLDGGNRDLRQRRDAGPRQSTRHRGRRRRRRRSRLRGRPRRRRPDGPRHPAREHDPGRCHPGGRIRHPHRAATEGREPALPGGRDPAARDHDAETLAGQGGVAREDCRAHGHRGAPQAAGRTNPHRGRRPFLRSAGVDASHCRRREGGGPHPRPGPGPRRAGGFLGSSRTCSARSRDCWACRRDWCS